MLDFQVMLPPLPVTGPPTRGLQGIWFLGRNNAALQSQTFDIASWTKTLATITANAVADPYTGAITADKLVEDATATSIHKVSQTFTQFSGVAVIGEWLVKAAERTWVLVRLDDNATDSGRYVNLATGALGTAIGSGTTVTATETSAGSGWWLISAARTSGAATTHAVLELATGDGGRTYSGDAASGVYVARFCINAGTVINPYQITTDHQTLPIYRGTAGTLQRGATSGAEASDPGLLNSGLSFVVDDYLKSSGALTNITLDGSWTIYIVALFAATAGSYLSIGSAATQAFVLYRSGASAVGGYHRVDAVYTYTSPSGIAISPTSPTAFVLSNAASVFTVKRLDTGTAVATASATEPTGVPLLFMGANYAIVIADAMTGYVVVLANVAHTTAEQARMYRWLKSELARPPYSLAVL